MQTRRASNSNLSSRVRIQRWYRGFRYKGNPGELVKKVSEYIQGLGLAKSLPLLRLEKGAKRNKTFYFFIAIESESIGVVPSPVESTKIFQLPFFKTPAVKNCTCFSYEQIKPMVGTAHDVTDYTNPIPYRAQPRVISESPLVLVDSRETKTLSDELIRQSSAKHEHLLYWLSASGNVTWESFKKTCEILDLSEPRCILRRLKILHYLTASDNGSKWQIHPPSLVNLGVNSETGDQTFLLHGQRSHRFLQKLKTFGSLKERHQPRGEAPRRIKLILPSQIMIETLTQSMQTYGYSINFAQSPTIPSLNDWQNSLARIEGILPFNFDLKIFDGKNFTDCIFQNQTGFYQFWTKDSNPQLRYSFFYDQNTQSWLQGDWYGLRFLAILSMGLNHEIYYNPEEKTLAIPIAQRLPELYESYLVMASGILPTYRDSFLIYDRIRLQLAREILDILGLTLKEV